MLGPLVEMKDDLNKSTDIARDMGEAITTLDVDEGMGWLEKHYTMESERRVLMDTIGLVSDGDGQDVTDGGNDDRSNVELF